MLCIVVGVGAVMVVVSAAATAAAIAAALTAAAAAAAATVTLLTQHIHDIRALYDFLARTQAWVSLHSSQFIVRNSPIAEPQFISEICFFIFIFFVCFVLFLFSSFLLHFRLFIFIVFN